MNRERVVGIACLLLSSIGMQAQGTYVIDGKVKNVKQGVCLDLFRMEGDVGHSIAVDTLWGDSFRFEMPVQEAGTTDRLSLMIRDGNLYTMAARLWAKEGSRIGVDIDGMIIYNWQVESDMPQQKTYQLFVEDSRDLWKGKEAIRMELMKLRRKYPQKPEDKELAEKVVATRDSLEEKERGLNVRINANVIARMKQLPIEEVWMDKLKSLALATKYMKDFPYRKEVEELYARLTDEQRQTSEALDIQACMFPVKTVAAQEQAADGDLFDLQGNVHRLSDFKGKAVLVDFWSRGCGPCVMALPEMKEISQKYKGRLEVVSISIDDKTNWEIASRHHDISWWNLSDLKGNHGIYAKYDAGSIPRYVFISPEGKVVEMWSGYGKGSLLKKVGELME